MKLIQLRPNPDREQPLLRQVRYAFKVDLEPNALESHVDRKPTSDWKSHTHLLAVVISRGIGIPPGKGPANQGSDVRDCSIFERPKEHRPYDSIKGFLFRKSKTSMKLFQRGFRNREC